MICNASINRIGVFVVDVAGDPVYAYWPTAAIYSGDNYWGIGSSDSADK